ncbi:outer membrane lipoprotein LolB [Aquabacterium sp.]|uniref:outer membrane lipoprotein LolB n=1 Tax=Aquabacterium sp. TaxID=1872578 RepID=UPI002C844601|nr:outer membrane lipoprotein LolB [Aquabacterium sp.]HSW06259.1 outer membrane lipoprotein LolB [Aquabacterium sp.]
MIAALRRGLSVWALGALLAVLMAGCATPRSPQAAADTLAGRLSIRVEGPAARSVSAAFELSGSPTQGQLVLSGPLGSTAAQARWAPGEAALITGDRRSDYSDLDSLAMEALGERIPIAALFDWLRGRAWAGAASKPRSDGEAGFEQLGWQISLARWTEGWVEARRAAAPVVTVRAKLDSAP